MEEDNAPDINSPGSSAKANAQHTNTVQTNGIDADNERKPALTAPAGGDDKMRTGGTGSAVTSEAAHDTPADAKQHQRQQQQQQEREKSGFHYHKTERSRICTDADNELFDENNPRIRRDIVRIIGQYLDSQGYTSTKVTLYDEANVKQQQESNYISDVVRLRAAILDGEWEEVDKICNSTYLKDKKHILYNVYKQQYLELIDDNESQKAFTTLNKNLKPLENQQSFQGEFRDLCYLLTTKSIQDAPAFKNWDGIASSREKLAEYLQNILEFEIVGRENEHQYLKPNRLISMLRQSVAYQIESCQYHADAVPTVSTLLSDYSPVVIPNKEQNEFVGHLGNVKCTDYVGPYG
ncbi:hypothetical protein GGI12_004823, partial [Dipsacomyces acuminosporus]